MATDPYRKVDTEIDRLNKSKLKHLPVALCRSGGSLYLQGTFPPKQGEYIPKQRRLPLKLKADINFLFDAKNIAIEIGTDLMLGRWKWEEAEPKPIALTIPDLIELHKQQYLDRNTNTPDTLVYWKKDYLYPFNKLPIDKPLSVDLCKAEIAKIARNTRSRSRYIKAYRQLLQIANMDASSLVSEKGSYRANKVVPREIPDESAIIKWGDKIPAAWQFYYFLLACFGLRGTEAHPSNCKLEDLATGEIVVYAGKTRDWRYVPSCSEKLFKTLYREPSWAKLDRTPSQLSEDFCKLLHDIGCEFTPYALRHHYAYFTLLDGWDTALSARYMGHSIALHQQTYWLCIDRARERQIRERRSLSSLQPSTDRILDS
jgi:hypothetical protein